MKEQHSCSEDHTEFPHQKGPGLLGKGGDCQSGATEPGMSHFRKKLKQKQNQKKTLKN